MPENRYSARWQRTEKHTTSNEEARTLRKSQYAEHVNALYDAVTDIYLQGWGQSWHFCRYPRGPERNATALARHEHCLAKALDISPTMRVLDVGCGVGGPAREIAALAGCRVTGLNLNEHQLEKSEKLIRDEGMHNQVDLVQGDYMRMPFEESQFDAVYAIEATIHAPSLEDVYAQCFRVLKPGGKFGLFEWALTDKFEPSEDLHTAIRLRLERGNGIPALQTITHAQNSMESAGFELCVAEDLATMNDTSSARGWYGWLLIVRNTWWGRPTMRVIIRVLEWVGVAPKGTCAITEDLLVANDALMAAGKAGIFTPMLLMVGKKPL
ncbi:putative tocopherol O-methyltransferase [Karstenula rhodostoma CBS 690.94]|uniref:Sterol 24-C-methyltransferase n=1 Tax=Karstenula rhodostoma CBS 690.94 TaxID=1392251 RepID=A0A9P4UEV1_9PLEO|nr:putative tocopherol O-methyltransferase [Karstenula rhodostoma CBS 690.94]